MNDAAMKINEEMLDALPEEERVGQRVQQDLHGEVRGWLVQMALIEKPARGGAVGSAMLWHVKSATVSVADRSLEPP
jgi:hypothetical protein